MTSASIPKTAPKQNRQDWPEGQRCSHAMISVHSDTKSAVERSSGGRQLYPEGHPVDPVEKSDYSPAGVGGFGRGGRGAAGLTAVDDAGLAAGRAAGRLVGRDWGFATLKDLIFR
jgi:hypothetical protein